MSKTTTTPREAQAKTYNPRSDTDPSKPRFPVRLTDEQYEKVSRASFEMRISMSKLASDALDLLLDGSDRSNRYMERQGYGRENGTRRSQPGASDGGTPAKRNRSADARKGGGSAGGAEAPKPRRRSVGKPRPRVDDAG